MRLEARDCGGPEGHRLAQKPHVAGHERVGVRRPGHRLAHAVSVPVADGELVVPMLPQASPATAVGRWPAGVSAIFPKEAEAADVLNGRCVQQRRFRPQFPDPLCAWPLPDDHLRRLGHGSGRGEEENYN